MNDFAQLFGLGCLIIVGRAAPWLVFEAGRRVLVVLSLGRGWLREVSGSAQSSSDPDNLSVERT